MQPPHHHHHHQQQQLPLPPSTGATAYHHHQQQPQQQAGPYAAPPLQHVGDVPLAQQQPQQQHQPQQIQHQHYYEVSVWAPPSAAPQGNVAAPVPQHSLQGIYVTSDQPAGVPQQLPLPQLQPALYTLPSSQHHHHQFHPLAAAGGVASTLPPLAAMPQHQHHNSFQSFAPPPHQPQQQIGAPYLFTAAAEPSGTMLPTDHSRHFHLAPQHQQQVSVTSTAGGIVASTAIQQIDQDGNAAGRHIAQASAQHPHQVPPPMPVLPTNPAVRIGGPRATVVPPAFGAAGSPSGRRSDTPVSKTSKGSGISGGVPLVARGRPERYKASICRHFAAPSGAVCHMGVNCRFAHSDDELRTEAQNIEDGLTTHEAVAARIAQRRPELLKHPAYATSAAAAPALAIMMSPPASSSTTGSDRQPIGSGGAGGGDESLASSSCLPPPSTTCDHAATVGSGA